jgi:hypothetical protein
MTGVQKLTLVEFDATKFGLYIDADKWKNLCTRYSSRRHRDEYLCMNLLITDSELLSLVDLGKHSYLGGKLMEKDGRNCVISIIISTPLKNNISNIQIIPEWCKLPTYILKYGDYEAEIQRRTCLYGTSRIFDYRDIFNQNPCCDSVKKITAICNYRFIQLNFHIKWNDDDLCENPTIPSSMAMMLIKSYRDNSYANKRYIKHQKLILNPAVPDWFLTESEYNKRYDIDTEKFIISKPANYVGHCDYADNVVLYIKKCVQREVAMKSNICAILARISRLSGGRCLNIIRCICVEIFNIIGRDNVYMFMAHYMERRTLHK